MYRLNEWFNSESPKGYSDQQAPGEDYNGRKVMIIKLKIMMIVRMYIMKSSYPPKIQVEFPFI